MARTWIFVLPIGLVLGSLGCPADNPAYDPSANSGGDGTGTSTSTSESSGESASGEESASGSTMTTDSTTEDPEDTGMEAPGEEGPDMMEEPEFCETSITSGLFPQFGSEQDFLGGCLSNYFGYVQLHGVSDSGGWDVTTCEGPCDVESCFGDVIEMGVDDLELAGLVALEPDVECVYVEIGPELDDDFGRCIYGRMSIFVDGGDVTSLVFHANRGGYKPEPMSLAGIQLGGWLPMVVDQDDANECLCEETNPEEVECCPGEFIVPKKFDIAPNTYVSPGDDWQELILDEDTYWFYAAQAQSGVACNPELETSWAALR